MFSICNIIKGVFIMISKRAHKRMYDPAISATLKSREQSYDVSIIEISRSGLRFVSENLYRRGDKLRFDISDSDLDLSITIRAKVINKYKSEKEGMFDYGVRFYRVFYWYEKKCIDELLVYSSKNRNNVLSNNISLVIAKETEKR